MHYKPGNKFKHSHKEDGFTLIEVLIALAIFSIGFLAVGSMQLRSTGGSTNARILTEASIWAQDRVETLMSLPYNDPNLVAGGTQYTVTTNNYSVDWQVWQFGDPTPAGIPGPANNTKTIRVTVTDTGRDNNSSTVTFIKARDV